MGLNLSRFCPNCLDKRLYQESITYCITQQSGWGGNCAVSDCCYYVFYSNSIIFDDYKPI